MTTHQTSSRFVSVQLNHLYEIGRIVASASEWKPALEEITHLVHSILIYDNLVVFLLDSNNKGLDVMYARSMGRGRSLEADISWGENLANQVNNTHQKTLEEPPPNVTGDRLKLPFLLGIPLLVNDRYLGVFLMIRYGGPPYTAEDVELAEFITQNIALLIERQNLQKDYQLLEAKHQQSQIQEGFIATISHELRNPLGFIKGYTTTLLRSDTIWDQKTQREFLSIIDQETDRLQELIDNLLDSARMQTGQLKFTYQLVRLDSLIKDVTTRFRLNHPEIKITLNIQGSIPPIKGDPVRLTQVFDNILSNCVKYAPGSEVIISLEAGKDGELLRIQDFGPGIAAEYLPMLFTRFFRNPNHVLNVHGSGLGLFISKQIIQSHNGQISAESSPGRGTIFIINLPCIQEPAETVFP